MAAAAPSYETLSPLATASNAGDRMPSDDGEPESYVVFRNEISLSSLDAISLDATAPEFFSLNVGAEDRIPTPSPAETPVVEREAKRALESGWFRDSCRFRSPMLQLHKEILDFCDFLAPTPEEQASRNSAIEGVFDVIKYIWPDCKVMVFGSFKTGLYLPSSDIDVVILGSNIRTPQIGLQALARALSQRGIAKKIQVIGKARVPIIKFVEKNTGVAFDVSFDVENGPKAAEYMKDAVSMLPPLRPLCLILKVFLQQRELNEVYSGGIGSYALIAMVIAMLRSLNESHLSPEQNLGVLLVKFFEFYAHKLNTWDVGISCSGRGTFFLKNSRGYYISRSFSKTVSSMFQMKGRPFLISIEDPQAPENDIGKNSYNYFQIRSAFMMAYSTLTDIKTITSLGPKKSILGTIIRPDPVLLERKGGSNGDVTFDSLLPGAGELVRSQYDEKQDILCNWRFDADANEEPLPRGGGVVENGVTSSGKKKRSPKDRDANGSVGRKERRKEKKRSKNQ